SGKPDTVTPGAVDAAACHVDSQNWGACDVVLYPHPVATTVVTVDVDVDKIDVFATVDADARLVATKRLNIDQRHAAKPRSGDTHYVTGRPLERRVGDEQPTLSGIGLVFRPQAGVGAHPQTGT